MSQAHIDFLVALRWLSLDKTTGPSRAICLLESCRLIESLVLLEKPVIHVPRPYGAVLSRDPLTGPFIDAGILEVRNSPLHTRNMTEVHDKSTNERMLRSSTDLAMLSSSLRQASESGDAYVPPVCGHWRLVEEYLTQFLQERPSIADREKILFAVKRSRAMRDARQAIEAFGPTYNRLVQATAEVLTDLKRHGRPMPIRMPPVAAVVLDSASKRDVIGRCALDLRDDLSDARVSLRDHEQRIADDSLSIGESVDAFRSLQSAMDRVLTHEKRRELVAISEWRNLVSLGHLAAEGATKGGFIGAAGAILGKPLQAVDAALQRREVLLMATIHERFMSIQSYGKIVGKLFGDAITDSEGSEAEQLVQQIGELSRDEVRRDAVQMIEIKWG